VRTIAAIDALTAADVQAAARGLIRPGGWVWVIVGDRRAIEPELRAAGTGPVEMVPDEALR
jgi:predicted Zn-dependent peptidase